MKHLLLSGLCWTLAISQTLAQNTQNPSHLQKNAASIIKALLQKTGYEQQTASLPSSVQLRSNHLRLDSTKTFVDYTLAPAADSTPLNRIRYEYPITGVRVEIEDVFESNAWVPTSRTTTTSDALGRIVNALGEVYDSLSMSWQLESSVQVFPHGNTLDLVDSIKVFSWDGVNWVTIFSTKNTYDAQNRLLKNETTFDFGGQSGLLVEKYTYDANGDNTLIEKFLESSGFSLPTGKQELQYANHRLIQTIDYNSDGTGSFVASTRTTYAYNPAGMVIQQNGYQWVPGVNDWAPTQVTTSAYDSAGRLINQETTTMQTGLPDEKVRLTYTYIEDENLATQSTYNWDAGQNVYVLSDRTYYYYSAGSSAVKPSPRPTQALIVSPNPTLDAVRFSFAEEVRVQVFDARGQMLESRTLQAGDLLNLAALPAGIYQVIALTAADCYSGKVVKL